MIIVKEKRNLTEGRPSRNWFDYILDHLNSDTAFNILINIFEGAPYAEGPLLQQAVSTLKKHLPAVPINALKGYVKAWVENHRDIL